MSDLHTRAEALLSWRIVGAAREPITFGTWDIRPVWRYFDMSNEPWDDQPWFQRVREQAATLHAEGIQQAAQLLADMADAEQLADNHPLRAVAEYLHGEAVERIAALIAAPRPVRAA